MNLHLFWPRTMLYLLSFAELLSFKIGFLMLGPVSILSTNLTTDHDLFCQITRPSLIGAVLFFSITCLFELVCLLLYTFVFAKLPIVKYYRSKAAAEGSKTVASDLAAAGISTEQSQVCRPLWQIPNGYAFLCSLLPFEIKCWWYRVRESCRSRRIP